MEVRFAAPELQELDKLRCEALSIPFFEEDQPLRGVLGLVDWRLCGWVSRLLVGRRVSGVDGEIVLMPVRPKLSIEKLFLFGLGSRESFDEARFHEAADRILRTLSQARVQLSACVLPGRTSELITPEVAIEALLEVAERHPEHDQCVVVDGIDAQKRMRPIVDRARRRARALAEKQ